MPHTIRWMGQVKLPAPSKSAIAAGTAVGAPALLIGVLARPLLFTNAQDWLPHLWLMWHQSLAIDANHLPSLFLNYSHSVFYPEYAFYGGTIYALCGILSLLLGGAPLEAYIATYCIGFAAAYGGWYWMARSAGLRSWRAHGPGLAFITSASYLTIIYGRGDWPEFMGVSTIPLLAASGLSVLRSDKLRVWPALTLAGTSVVFFGSHNLTLLWGSTFLVLLGATIVICVPSARKQIRRRGAIRFAGLTFPALLVNAWFLLPTIAYQSHTVAGSGHLEGSRYWYRSLHQFMFLVEGRYLFSIDRTALPGTTYFLALPLPVIAWTAIGAAIVLGTGLRGPWARVLLIVLGTTFLLFLMMTHAGLILALPAPYTFLEFSYRIESYVLMGISGALLSVLALTQRSAARRSRFWVLILLPVLLASVIGAIHQLDASPHEPGRSDTLNSYLTPVLPGGAELRGLKDFWNVELPDVSFPRRPATVYFAPNAVHGDRASVIAHVQPGQLVKSNIASGPEFVHVTGATIIAHDSEGNDVLEIDPSMNAVTPGRRSAVRITLSPAHSLPIVLGRLLSSIGALALVIQLAVLIARGRKAARTHSGRARETALLAERLL